MADANERNADDYDIDIIDSKNVGSDEIIHIVEVLEDGEQDEEKTERKLNLTDEEKRVLISFYRQHPVLWNGKAYPYQKNREEKTSLREQMFDLFDGKYKVEVLERTFHVLRTSMLREVKTTDEDGMHLSDKKWKFFDDLIFLKDVLKRGRNKRTVQISPEDTKYIIQFYSYNKTLLQEQQNKTNLEEHQSLIERLATELHNKYPIRAIKSHFDSLRNIYKREKRWVSKYNKGKLLDPSFSSAWEYYNDMENLEQSTTAKQSKPNEEAEPQNTQHHQSSYNHENHTFENGNGQYQVVIATDDTNGGKEECYTISNDRNKATGPPPFIITSTSSAYDHSYNNIETRTNQTSNNTPSSLPTPYHTLKRKLEEERPPGASIYRAESAQRFGQVVADSLMQCEVKDWPRMKKQIMDLFFEYEVEKEK